MLTWKCISLSWAKNFPHANMALHHQELCPCRAQKVFLTLFFLFCFLLFFFYAREAFSLYFSSNLQLAILYMTAPEIFDHHASSNNDVTCYRPQGWWNPADSTATKFLKQTISVHMVLCMSEHVRKTHFQTICSHHAITAASCCVTCLLSITCHTGLHGHLSANVYMHVLVRAWHKLWLEFIFLLPWKSSLVETTLTGLAAMALLCSLSPADISVPSYTHVTVHTCHTYW